MSNKFGTGGEIRFPSFVRHELPRTQTNKSRSVDPGRTQRTIMKIVLGRWISVITGIIPDVSITGKDHSATDSIESRPIRISDKSVHTGRWAQNAVWPDHSRRTKIIRLSLCILGFRRHKTQDSGNLQSILIGRRKQPNF